MNLAGGELRRRAARDRPGAALVLADREERHVAEQVVARADHAIEARLAQAEIGEERRGVGAFELRRSRARSSRRAPPPCVAACARNAVRPVCSAAASNVGADVGEVGFVEIDHEQQRLGREELEAAQPLEIVARQAASARSGLPSSSAALQRSTRSRSFSSSGERALLQILLDALEPPLGDAEVGEDQLVLHRLRVARRVDRAGRMRDRRRRETRGRRGRARRRSCSRRRRPAPARRFARARRCR